MITFDGELQDLLQLLDPLLLQKAQRSALTRMRRKATTHISRQARTKYNISASAVKEAVSRRANFSLGADRQSASIDFIGRRIGLINFGARIKKVSTPRGRRDGATVKLYKQKPRYQTKRGFIAAGQGGNVHVFQREKASQKSRLPIKALYGPSVPQMVGTDDVVGSTDRFVQQEYPVELIRQIEFQLSKL